MAQNGNYPNITGKVAIVTGGSTGIGRATASFAAGQVFVTDGGYTAH